LATLAAGAAHELSTPLATIAVVAKELGHQLIPLHGSSPLVEDIQLIRNQVERCRLVLVHMAADAGSSTGEVFSPVTTHTLCQETLSQLPQAYRVHITHHAHPEAGCTYLLPLRSLAQALRGLVKNALEASPPESTVQWHCHNTPRALVLKIQDTGCGMPASVLAHMGEPFFTTKEPGHGMGLGVFLARTLIERLNGTLECVSNPSQGTCITVSIPQPAIATMENLAHDHPRTF
jgi:two-component system sensor histidine kinase RegB